LLFSFVIQGKTDINNRADDRQTKLIRLMCRHIDRQNILRETDSRERKRERQQRQRQQRERKGEASKRKGDTAERKGERVRD